MIQVLKLMLPVMIPSWRFFDVIAPAPCLEIAILDDKYDPKRAWRQFRPRSKALSTHDLLRRMFWNARWNESLFLTSLAERLMHGEEAFAKREIFARIAKDIDVQGFMQFRLVFSYRDEDEIVSDVVYTSSIVPLNERGRDEL